MKKSLFALMLLSLFARAGSWNMATPYPDNEFHEENIKQFIADVKTATDGKVDITLHSGASLYKAPEIFKAVRANQVQLGELLVSSLGNDDPLFQLDTIPFLATDYAAAQKLWAVSREAVSAALEKKGVVLLYTTPWPGQNFYTKGEVADASYFSGKKMRAYNAMTSAIAAHLGASPTTVEVPDIAQAFSTGQIDAMMTSSATGANSQAWDFVGNYTRVNAWYPKNMIFINKKVWDKLDDATKSAIRGAAEAAEKRGWQMSADVNDANEKILADNGMTVADASEALAAELGKVRDKMVEDWLKAAGDAGKAILDRYRE